MKEKINKRVKKTDLSITILLIIGIVAVLNFFSYRIFLRWDLTENKVYSISDATKNTLKNLDDIVNIKAYFSANLPQYFASTRQEVSDILDEYATYSDGRVRVEFIDPGDDEEMQRELFMIGIPQLTFDVREKDKAELVNGYMGIGISHGGKTEAIPAIKSGISDLEYQLTTAIKKVVTDEIAVVGYLSSNGTVSLEEMTAAEQKLRELYLVSNIALEGEEPKIPDDIDTLIINGPKTAFDENQLKAVNSFIKRGGALFVLWDGVIVEQGLNAVKNSSGLDELLKKYGVTVNQNLVGDTRSGIASFSQGFFTFSSNYALWPKINSDGVNKDFSSVANLENVVLPWVSSIDIAAEKFPEGAYHYLLNTTDKSWKIQDNFNIAPNNANTPQGNLGKNSLAVSINGEISDPYSESGDKMNIRMIVVGDSNFATDGFVGNNPDNLTLFQNLVDALSFDEDLINIRSKSATSRPIKEDLSEGAKMAIKYLNIFGLTVVVVAFGMVRYFMRRKSRFVDDI